MTAMAQEVYDECVMDIVAPEALLGDAITIKVGHSSSLKALSLLTIQIATQDLPLQHITIRSLDFHCPFKLTTTRSGELNAFILYFDTFFTTDGKDLPPDSQASVHKGDFAPGEVLRLGERRNSESGEERRRSVDATGRRKKSVDVTNAGMGTIDEKEKLASSPRAIETPLPTSSSATPLPPSLSPSSSFGPTSILSASSGKRPTLIHGSTSRRESSGAGLPKSVSFSTGPKSMPTHWKQSIFLLRTPVRVRKGALVSAPRSVYNH